MSERIAGGSDGAKAALDGRRTAGCSLSAGGKILIVEDSDLLHRMYGMIFTPITNKGVALLRANNGREALNVLAANPDIALILLDINMPVMSGLEFLTYRGRERVFLDIPVIIISTEGKESDTLRGLEAGASGYVTKPFQPKELLDLIDRLVPEMGR